MRDPDLRAPAVRRVARALLKGIGRPRAELSIVFTDDARMRVLNRTFRGIDRTTDVLSFSQLEGEPSPGEDMLGDIVISLDAARRQAPRYRRTFQQELDRLLVHGVLHLTGHDHKRRAEGERMRAEERRLLRVLREAAAAGTA